MSEDGSLNKDTVESKPGSENLLPLCIRKIAKTLLALFCEKNRSILYQL